MLQLLHSFAADSAIILNTVIIYYRHLRNSINDVFTITNGFVQTYLFRTNTLSVEYYNNYIYLISVLQLNRL